MSIKKYLTKKNLLILSIILIFVIYFLGTFISSTIKKRASSQSTPLISETSSTKPVFNTSETSSTQIEAFLREYQFMFYHLPNTQNTTSLGWNNDTPLIVQNNSIINVLNNKSIKDYSSNSIIILNNSGEGLVVSEDTASIFNNTTKNEIIVNESDRNAFTYLWYQKPNSNILLSDDKRTISLNNLQSLESFPLYTTDTDINPLSISTNGTQISFTDNNNLYLVEPSKETKKTALSDTTTESITFWLHDNLFIVEKVKIPRILDFIMYVDQKDLSFTQIITSSSMINRLNLSVRPAINQKQDMILFAENGGLVWVLSRDQAITRIYPQLKIPAEMWDKSY